MPPALALAPAHVLVAALTTLGCGVKSFPELPASVASPAPGLAAPVAVPAPGLPAPVSAQSAAPGLAAAAPKQSSNGSSLSEGSRRILNSKNALDTPYMVYLQMSSKNAKLMAYKGWVCGGIIVSPLYVLSSAACVEDAEHFYVVAGSKKHVDGANAASDPCSKNRRKVIWKCVPKDYEFLATDSKRWMTNDLAIVKVEHPFNFDRVEPGCDYAASQICYNTNDTTLEAAEAKGAVYGWGSLAKFRALFVKNRTRLRAPDEEQSVEDLQMAHVNIMSKDECVKKWPTKYHEIIQKYMICTNDTKTDSGTGDCKDKLAKCADINFSDDVRMRSWPMDTGHHGQRRLLLQRQHDQHDQLQRRLMATSAPAELSAADDTTNNKDSSGFEMPALRGKKRFKGHYNSSTRLSAFKSVYLSTILPDSIEDKVPITGGICENDHGGPLVVQNAGGSDVAVGIISACKVDLVTKECRGPFLFTSIMANKELIECIVLGSYKKTCRKMLRAGVNNRNWNVHWRSEDA